MAAPSPGFDRRTTTSRPFIATVAVLMLAFCLAASGLVAGAERAAAAAPSTVEIADTSDALDEAALAAAINEIDFHVPTDVVVLTIDGSGANQLNEAVLNYARTDNPEWISADDEKWADGLFILAVDPRGRQVGTYFGDDREVSQGAQDRIQEATKSDFRAGRWDAGVLSGVKEAAILIGRPWYRHPGFYVFGGVLAAGGLFTALGVAGYRRGNRQKVDAALVRGDDHLASVSAALRATDQNAKRIPSTSSYGAKVLERYATFAQERRDLLAEREELGGMDERARAAKSAADRAGTWADRTAALDAFDDVVADAADLLTMSGEWQAAWKRQAARFREDVDAVPELVDLEPAAAGSPEAGELLEFAGRARVDLSSIGSRLTARQITAELALDDLQKLRVRLSDLFESFADVVTESYAKTDAERTTMREEMDSTRRSATGSHGNILDVTYPALFLLHGHSFRTWHSEGTSAVEAARSSSTSTGYGSSGGGFSGAGSSSRF
ncbi:DUF5129 domain-containing protein [Zhihengliuella halotolerans]|uniref:Uncharacterized protein DUF5129 n=1 Tax=Zhihengliuella halotolerans TaxID=370736 RepID=A0A4V2GA16_9MICC|nr:DUF5129 domain-containing protein [Zhihengliuella halotolerans]RZU62506.1 uncharacterized protein DUF5129 [Zhihengliuella halotolerans]